MKRSKVIFQILFISVILTLAVTGCAKDEKSSDASGTSGAVTSEYKFASGGKTGTYYPLAQAVADLENKELSLNISVLETGGSVDNIQRISDKTANFAFVQNDVLDYAYNGVELFKDKPKLNNFSAVCALYPEFVQIVVSKDSDIHSVGALSGKRVSVGAKDSGVELNAMQILSASAIDLSTIEIFHYNFKESAEALKNGEIDAFFVVSGVPNQSIIELSQSKPIDLLNIDPVVYDALTSKYTFYKKADLPKEVYNTQENVNTVSVISVLVCSNDMSEEEIYNFTKTFYSNLSKLGQANEKAKSFTLTGAKNGVTIPFHPGAAKYLKEMNIK